MKKFRKWTALFCAGVMAVTSLAGCGGGSGEKNSMEKNEGNGDVELTAAEKSMGRYLEEEVLVPEVSDQPEYYAAPWLGKRDDGKVVMADKNLGIYTSEDHGESWEAAGCPWSELWENTYISDIALSPDGAAAIVGVLFEEESEGGDETEGSSGSEAAPESAGEKADGIKGEMEDVEGEPEESAGAEEGSGGEADDGTEGYGVEVEENRYYYVDPEGTITEIPFDGGADEEITKFAFDRQGRLYGFGFESRGYLFDLEAGTAKKLFEGEGLIDSVCFTEQYMVAFTSRNEVILFDLEKGMPVEDDRTLQDFVTENVGSSGGSVEWGYDIIATSGEEGDILYLAFQGGLYRHVIGGTVMEQIIDGSITAFGDPSAELLAMEMLPDNEFIVLYTGRKLYKYTYDPDVPSVPEHELKVYSLVENDSLRQAVSLFQKEHQDVYVRYEIGMTGDDSITKEDAIRNLNTKILAGEGPDIMLLDGLSQDSYVEKGVLADVSGLVEEMSGEEALFPNIVETCRKDGKLYALPIRVQVPMMAGRADYVEKIEDLESLADVVEEIREEKPEGAVLGLAPAEGLLRVLSLTSKGAWADETGAVDEEALTEFLTAAKRIWQAEISGVDERLLEHSANYGGGIAWEEGMEYAAVSERAVSIGMKQQLLAVGKVCRVDFDYDVLTSVAGQEEDFRFGFWNGQVENGLIPDGMAGLLSNSAEDELAIAFYRFLYGRKLQDMDLTGGLPVNMASFDTFAVNPYMDPDGFMEDNVAGALVVSDDMGDTYHVDLIWPDEEDFGKLKDTVSGLRVVNAGDAAIEEAVYEVGREVLESDMTVEEAVREIVKRSAIYLAE